MSDCNYIRKNELKKEREFIENLLRQVKKDLKKKWKFSFSNGLVGSAKRKLVIVKGKSTWDLDYKIKMTSKKVEQIKKSSELFELKNDIKTFLNKHTTEKYNAKLSTSVVTLNKYNKTRDLSMNYDFAIINSEGKILKHKTKNDVQWNEISNFPKAISRYGEIKYAKKWNKLREIYKNKKCNNEEGKPGYSIFAESIKETLEHFKEW